MGSWLRNAQIIQTCPLLERGFEILGFEIRYAKASAGMRRRVSVHCHAPATTDVMPECNMGFCQPLRVVAPTPAAGQNQFRHTWSPVVSAGDASEEGGGVTASTALTGLGAAASSQSVRGEMSAPFVGHGVLA